VALISWFSPFWRASLRQSGPGTLLASGSTDLFLPTDFSPYPWMEYALREYGIKGISARGRTVNVVAYLKATGVGRSNDETAWCSAFVNWCMLMAGFPGSGKANARSWLEWGGVSLEFPAYGSVVVLWRGARNGPLGHVGFFVGMQGDRLLLLGGNQGNAVSIRPYPKERVLGIRWLEGFPVPEFNENLLH
jgi:uncharacterized protein (TIGR02594 family)